LQIDGKSYTEDELSEEAHEEVRRLPYLALTAEGVKAQTAFAFTSQKAYEHWISRSHLSGVYDKIVAARNAVPYEPEREADRAKEHATRVNKETETFLSALRANNVSTNRLPSSAS
jgi:hypothetical protein